MFSRIAVLGIVVLFVSSVTPAGAHLKAHSDANDTQGDLDIRAVSIAKERYNQTRSFLVTIKTHERFNERDLIDGRLSADFDSRGDSGRDFYLLIDLYEGSYPICGIYDDDGFSQAGAEVSFTDRSATCKFQRSAIRPNKHIRWRVKTESSQNTDIAPNGGGWFQH